MVPWDANKKVRDLGSKPGLWYAQEANIVQAQEGMYKVNFTWQAIEFGVS